MSASKFGCRVNYKPESGWTGRTRKSGWETRAALSLFTCKYTGKQGFLKIYLRFFLIRLSQLPVKTGAELPSSQECPIQGDGSLPGEGAGGSFPLD
jgi:hypothetical protein